jgi:hypothetical protein
MRNLYEHYSRQRRELYSIKYSIGRAQALI